MFARELLPLLLLVPHFQQAASPPVLPPASAPASSFRISGKVIDSVTGQPLARASVTLNLTNSPDVSNPPDPTRFGNTDAEGVFAFAGLPPGKYILSASRRGFVPQMYQQHEGFTTAITVGPGFPSEHLIFRLRPGASISGVVADESNDPIRHADVYTDARRKTLRFQSTNTDDQGRYHFSQLEPGTYFVGVSAQPWYAQHPVRHLAAQENQQTFVTHIAVPSEQNQGLDVVYPIAFYSNATDLQGAAPIALHPGDRAITDFRMRPVPALHILVRTSATDPEQNAGVGVTQTFAENDMMGIPAQVNQISPGLTEITGIPQGRLNLVLNTQHGNVMMHRSQSVQLQDEAEVDLARDTPSLVVSGVLRLEDGSPVPQPARVQLRSLATGEIFDATVAAAGEFSFKDSPVEPGNYELMIVEPQALFIRSLSSKNAKTSGRSFEITTAANVSVTINASKGSGQVTGVALKKDKPASGVMIVLAPLDLKSNPELFRRDQSDSDGTFALNSVVPGRYTLMAIEDGWDLEWADPGVLRKYIAGGESVQIAPNQKVDVPVKVQ